MEPLLVLGSWPKSAEQREFGDAVAVDVGGRGPEHRPLVVDHHVAIPAGIFVPRQLGPAGGHRDDIELAVVIDVGDRHAVPAPKLVADDMRAELNRGGGRGGGGQGDGEEGSRADGNRSNDRCVFEGIYRDIHDASIDIRGERNTRNTRMRGRQGIAGNFRNLRTQLRIGAYYIS